MTFTMVNSVEPRKQKKNLQKFIKEFMSMSAQTARVSFCEEEYAHVHSCYSSLYKACARSGEPVDAILVYGDVYLIKRDK